MIQIRSNIFETNSSSSHSLVVYREDKPLTTPVNGEWHVNNVGIMYLWEDHLTFGRGFDIITDWYGRACFALASYADDERKRAEIEEILYKNVEGLKQIQYRGSWYDKPCYGYIDHQSAGLLQRFLETKNISLYDFIFNDRYVVIIDGDEYNIFDTIRKLPSWNEDTVGVVYA